MDLSSLLVVIHNRTQPTKILFGEANPQFISLVDDEPGYFELLSRAAVQYFIAVDPQGVGFDHLNDVADDFFG